MARRVPAGLPPDTVLRNGAILIADQCGFTRTVLTQGAAVALSRIHAIRRLLVPVMRSSGGEVYKVEADNLFAFFTGPGEALRCALECHRVLAADGRRRRLREPLAVGIGIGFGEMLYLPSEDDYYGAEVNLASKLGEDIAEGGETLLTERAAAPLALEPSTAGRPGRWRRVALSGVSIRFRPWTA